MILGLVSGSMWLASRKSRGLAFAMTWFDMDQVVQRASGMPWDAKGRARSKRECDVETLEERVLYKLLWQSRGRRKNDKQVAEQP